MLMRTQQINTVWHATSPWWLRLLKGNVPIVVFLLLSMLGMGATFWYFSPHGGDTPALVASALEQSLSAPIFKALPPKPVTQRLAQSPVPRRIGIISGHLGSDSGSVCDDGLTEADVNAAIVEKVVETLESRGIRTDVLEEFDSRLVGYSATAIVSVHADSCTYINDFATGFKIAGSSLTDSSKLSICVEQSYGEATHLPYHENTITPHMTDYHAFREIGSGTPAIIIEVGFINLDRELLTQNTALPAAGIANGILCFLGAR
jgi:N-acetylmuramoyl-L-alanine amidase